MCFCYQDPEDLPFKRGDVLTILQKDEDEWWMARNRNGDTGLVPKPYIEKVLVFVIHISCPQAIHRKSTRFVTPFLSPSHT